MTAPDVTKPPVDDLQRQYAEVAGNPYEFTWADRDWTLPHMRDLDIFLLTELENLNPTAMTADDLTSLFDRIFGPEQATEWARVPKPLTFLNLMLKRWTEHSGRQEGESPASEGSSTSTERPSKRTSTGSTASASRRRSTAKRATPAKAATRRANS